MNSRPKNILVLDMWASKSGALGPNKNWLYNNLAQDYNVEILNPSSERLLDLYLLLRSFSPNRSRWGGRYYLLKECANKTPKAFLRHTNRFADALKALSKRPDLIFQIGGLFGPIGVPSIPCVSYHDQTVRMVEEGWKEWIPADFDQFRDEWYRLEGNLYQNMTKVVTYSEATKNSMITHYGVNDGHLEVINTACKVPYPTPEEALSPRKRQLLFVSTNFYQKGGDIILEALPLLKDIFPGIRLIIAGGKLPPEVILDDPAVEYVGVLPMNELRRYYLESELLLHPARYDAFPNVLKEAVACGLPVIATACCGMPEILDHGRAGLLMRDLSQKELVSQVVGLLRDPQLYRQIQERCLIVRERFRPEFVGSQFKRLFKSLLNDE